MKQHRLPVLALLLLGGCASRVLVQPTAVSGQPDHIYFVEQQAGQGSRLIKCDILPDNSASCTPQYTLD